MRRRSDGGRRGARRVRKWLPFLSLSLFFCFFGCIRGLGRGRRKSTTQETPPLFRAPPRLAPPRTPPPRRTSVPDGKRAPKNARVFRAANHASPSFSFVKRHEVRISLRSIYELHDCEQSANESPAGIELVERGGDVRFC